jgi:hypothetical protein
MSASSVSGTNPLLAKYEDFCGRGNLPDGKEEPYFCEETIFDPEVLKKTLKVVSKLPGLSKGDGIRTNVLVYEMHEVTFSDDHKVLTEEPLLRHSMTYYTSDGFAPHLKKAKWEIAIEKARLTVMERFASVLGLKGKHRIWMNCLRYSLPKGKDVDVVKWHSDHNKGWTMVTMMTDPNGTDGWSGGEIVLAPTKKMPVKQKDAPPMEVPEESQAVKIGHSYNSAIFFHNHETNHTVTPLRADGKSKTSERIIWTCEDHCPVFCADKK